MVWYVSVLNPVEVKSSRFACEYQYKSANAVTY